MLRVFHYIIVFVLLLCGFNCASSASYQQENTIQQTLLPFDSFEKEALVARRSQNLDGEGIGYFVDENSAEYSLDENSLLFDFIKKKYYQNKLFTGSYMMLAQGKQFNSYIVNVENNSYIVNIDSQNHVLSDMRLIDRKGKSIITRHSPKASDPTIIYNSYLIDTNLILTIYSDELIKYSELNHRWVRLVKMNQKRYKITDTGHIIELDAKVFPSHLADYKPVNPDNCFAAVAKSSRYLFAYNARRTALPLSGKDYIRSSPDATEFYDMARSTQCYRELAHNYLLLPPINDHAVVLFIGYDFKRSHENDTLYLVTVNRERIIKDVMVIYYQRNDDKQKINFTINPEYRIELQMTDSNGKTLMQSYQINQQGQFE